MKRVIMSVVFVLSAAQAGCGTDGPSEPSSSTSEATQATKVCDWVLKCSTTGALFEEFGPIQGVQQQCLAGCPGGVCTIVSSSECGGG
jgi:hypothetical protein